MGATLDHLLDRKINSLFVNIAFPSSFTRESRFPVKVYIHGGFLQWGSPHGLIIQAQYVAQERSEVRVHVGYRLSVLGFLVCDEPKIDGNFGFKDPWLALQWVRENIVGFGGDPINVQPCAFRCTTPKTAAELRPQFAALYRVLNLDPASPSTLTTLCDPSLIPAATLHFLETDEVGVENGTYRGCLDGTWIPISPDPMTWQRSGNLARKLPEKGVTNIIIGDLAEEWYLYSIAHPVREPRDVFPNILRYYPRPIAERLVEKYRTLSDDASVEEAKKLMGEILGDGQVRVPARMFVRDFC